MFKELDYDSIDSEMYCYCLYTCNEICYMRCQAMESDPTPSARLSIDSYENGPFEGDIWSGTGCYPGMVA